MSDSTTTFLKGKLTEDGFTKLMRINNTNLNEFIEKYIKLCNPDRVFVCTDDPYDLNYIREAAVKSGEEYKLAMEGHTVHFDNYYDQARDKDNTLILLPEGESLDSSIETGERIPLLKDVHEILKDIMKGHVMLVRFFCLGPTHSEFSIPAVQLTDSSYVAHSEDVLYRQGYEEFIRQGANARFFKFVHSQGALDERKTSKNLNKRRIYIDLADEIVYTTNTQYGGNTIGLKKLAMRLAIKRGSQEGWLTEHMLVMGVHGPNDRTTYFTGAFPSMCGKTSTAMMEGETIVGDDIAYMRKKNGDVRAVNVEKGIFGIIMGVNKKDDPIQWKALHSPNEVIFSNILITSDKQAYWVGKDDPLPQGGVNHSGEWWPGKKDENGVEIPPSHPNARFTISLDTMENLDPAAHDPKGVSVGGIVYGGRDADTSVPVEETFDWIHGIVTKGAALESETTAATLGKEGVRKFNPMSNLDFLSIPIGRYIHNNIKFGKDLKNPPKIFSVNYFLLDENQKFLNAKTDKQVWYKWMELRVHNDVEAIPTPTGKIPEYEDLKQLFADVFKKEYGEEDYLRQFTIRIPENLAKLERILNIYKETLETPSEVFEILEAQRERLIKKQQKFGDYVTPDKL